MFIQTNNSLVHFVSFCDSIEYRFFLIMYCDSQYVSPINIISEPWELSMKQQYHLTEDSCCKSYVDKYG